MLVKIYNVLLTIDIETLVLYSMNVKGVKIS